MTSFSIEFQKLVLALCSLLCSLALAQGTDQNLKWEETQLKTLDFRFFDYSILSLDVRILLLVLIGPSRTQTTLTWLCPSSESNLVPPHKL